MKYIKYFIQFILTILSFMILKKYLDLIYRQAYGKIFEKIGPYFRSKKIINANIKRAFPNIVKNLIKINNLMWNNYGRVFAEFMFIKDFRHGKLLRI